MSKGTGREGPQGRSCADRCCNRRGFDVCVSAYVLEIIGTRWPARPAGDTEDVRVWQPPVGGKVEQHEARSGRYSCDGFAKSQERTPHAEPIGTLVARSR